MREDDIEALRQAETHVQLTSIVIELQNKLQETLNPMLQDAFAGVTDQLDELRERVERLEQGS